MKRDLDGMPIVGTQSKELGVRVPPNDHADVDVGYDGLVKLDGGGMSVASHWSYLKPHLVPKRLKSTFSGAAGADSLSIYRFGDGAFGAAAVNEHLDLSLKPGSSQHGNIVPAVSMPIQDFLGYLAGTRNEWIIEEPSNA